MKITKMHGAGNDFILLDGINNKYDDLESIAKQLCDRHFGIGADGIMVCEKSDIADVKMVYYNSDGSFGEMCGNGIRCFSKFVYDEGLAKSEKITIETAAGIKTAVLDIDGKKVQKVEIDMGVPVFQAEKIPVRLNRDKILLEKIEVCGQSFDFSAVLMGVPHAVIFVEDLDKTDVNTIGMNIEKHEIFPKKINVNFVEVTNRNKIKVKTWERGAGRTLACGTGCCASVILGNALGYLDSETEVAAEGGNLFITLTGSGNVKMKGEAQTILVGEFLL